MDSKLVTKVLDAMFEKHFAAKIAELNSGIKPWAAPGKKLYKLTYFVPNDSCTELSTTDLTFLNQSKAVSVAETAIEIPAKKNWQVKFTPEQVEKMLANEEYFTEIISRTITEIYFQILASVKPTSGELRGNYIIDCDSSGPKSKCTSYFFKGKSTYSLMFYSQCKRLGGNDYFEA